MPHDASTSMLANPHARLKPLGEFFELPQLPLEKPLILIGSGRSVHLRLRSRTVDGVHALILNLDGRLYIRDLGSHTHLKINNHAQRDATLRPGDLIGIGRITFELIAPASDSAEAKRAPVPPRASLTLANRRFALDQPVLLIGRDARCDLVLRDESVGTKHAIIFAAGGVHYVRSLRSKRILIVNGHTVRLAMLHDGDVIAMGRTTLTYCSAQPTIEQRIHAPTEAALEHVTPKCVDDGQHADEVQVVEPRAPVTDATDVPPMVTAADAHAKLAPAVSLDPIAPPTSSGTDIQVGSAPVEVEQADIDESPAFESVESSFAADIQGRSAPASIDLPGSVQSLEITAPPPVESPSPPESSQVAAAAPGASSDIAIERLADARESAATAASLGAFSQASPTPGDSGEFAEPDTHLNEPAGDSRSGMTIEMNDLPDEEELPVPSAWGPLAMAVATARNPNAVAESRQPAAPSAPTPIQKTRLRRLRWWIWVLAAGGALIILATAALLIARAPR